MLHSKTHFCVAPCIILCLGVPILFYFFKLEHQRLLENQVTTRPLRFLLIDDSDSKSKSFFTSNTLQNMLKGKKRTDVYLKDRRFGYNQSTYPAKMAFVSREIERLAFSNQPSEVLIVHLNDECTIGDWVSLARMAETAGLRRYNYWRDDFYFFGNYKINDNH